MKTAAQALRIPLGRTLADRLVLGVFFFLGTLLGAYVEIPLPFTPVPLTLQTLFVLLGAAYLGAGWASGVQASYLGAGAAGASVFAGAAAGAIHLAGPTAGYLWAFVPASLLVGSLWAGASARGYLFRLLLLAAADALILLCGSVWLGLLLKTTPGQALLLGAVPFVPGEIVKVLAAAALSPRAAQKAP